MSKLNLPQLFKDAKFIVSKHSPEILTGLGLASMATTVVLVATATPKAIRLLEEKKAELKTEKIPGGEIVKTTWKCYVPAAITFTVGTACIIGASSVNARRNAALAAAYTISEKALTEYKDAVIETVGEAKEKVIKEKVAENQLEKDPVTNKEVFITSSGETLCYDSISGRYFKSSMEKIRSVVNNVNAEMISHMYVSLNDFYDQLGLETTEIGDDLGWNRDKGQLELDYTTKLASDGRPCLVINYMTRPEYDYYNFL